MKFYRLKSTQFLPISIGDAWSFFSDPSNLSKITPGHMQFIITCEIPKNVFPGLIVTYKLFPFPFFPVNWMTEITHVKENEYFVDEQRSGPYQIWHHLHQFKEVEGGVEMTDTLDYAMPYGLIGVFVHWLFVKKQILRIFDYRFNKLNEIFKR